MKTFRYLLAIGLAAEALLILLNIPLALVGGILALFLAGLSLSVPSSVGFIALFGIAVLNGVVLVTYFNQLHREEGLPIREAAVVGGLVTSTALTLLVLPVLYRWLHREPVRY